MQVNSRRWVPLKRRPTKRTAHLSLIRQKRKRKEGDSDSTDKEQPLVDYSVGEFLLVHSSVWPKLLCNIQCSECGEQELRAVISKSMGLSSKISLKCRACG